MQKKINQIESRNIQKKKNPLFERIPDLIRIKAKID